MTTALITGGSSGIGKAIAYRLAEAGYDLVLAARGPEALLAVAEDLRSRFSIQAIGIPTDVRDSQQVETLVQKAIQELGRVDVLVNNAGIYASGPVEQFSLEDWHRTIDTNLWGYIHTVQALLPHFLAQGSGRIVNICSISGKVPMPYLVPYTTSKFAIAGFSQALNTELSPKGIRVSGIYPNLIRTGLTERGIFRGQDAEDRQVRQQQVEETMQMPTTEKPEDVANAVWHAISQDRPEVVVGTAKLMGGIQKLLPRLTQWSLRKIFQSKG